MRWPTRTQRWTAPRCATAWPRNCRTTCCPPPSSCSQPAAHAQRQDRPQGRCRCRRRNGARWWRHRRTWNASWWRSGRKCCNCSSQGSPITSSNWGGDSLSALRVLTMLDKQLPDHGLGMSICSTIRTSPAWARALTDRNLAGSEVVCLRRGGRQAHAVLLPRTAGQHPGVRGTGQPPRPPTSRPPALSATRCPAATANSWPYRRSRGATPTISAATAPASR